MHATRNRPVGNRPGNRPAGRPAGRTTGRPSRKRIAVIALIAAGAVLLVIAIVSLIVALMPKPAEAGPTPGTTLLTAANTKAAAAAESGNAAARDAAAYLAEQPTAVWLTPENTGIGEVGPAVQELIDQARETGATLTLVVYGLPERDCGQFSAGGLDPADYPDWTAEIGETLRAASGVKAIVVLEPDSLALAPECGNVDERASQLNAAIDDLTADNVWIYLDGGHSQWLPVSEMSGLLKQAGVDRVRGFATNVSNYNDSAAEIDYAHRLSEALGGSAHAVIDTSRNGAGSTGEWCNPAGRLIGDPGATFGDDVVDVNLWIKPPGESDGECNGGPAAGTWWTKAAVELTRNATG